MQSTSRLGAFTHRPGSRPPSSGIIACNSTPIAKLYTRPPAIRGFRKRRFYGRNRVHLREALDVALPALGKTGTSAGDVFPEAVSKASGGKPIGSSRYFRGSRMGHGNDTCTGTQT